ncbi:WxL domain-containing protein [Enterococcus casseliflavus]|nr:WxL domain-containing protein [Enterococcus casseliflavus]MBF0015427.1 WxL domain-containing protein [Enterococcus casseliflavus]
MKKMLMASIVLLGSMSIGLETGQTAEYDSATSAITEGKITILENDSPDPDITDPEDPEEPVEPEDPTNPNLGTLRINYISNFNFGEIENVSREINQSAKLVVITDSNNNKGMRVPFVATEDRRGSERGGWELRVSQPSQMKDTNDHELKGATITLSGLRYVKQDETTPQINPNDVILNSQEQILVSANANQGAGAWSLALGKTIDEETTDGVTLNIPANTIKNDADYSTSIVWELVADPTI